MSGHDTLRQSPRDLSSALKHDNLLQMNQNEYIIITTTNDADLYSSTLLRPVLTI